MSQTEEAESELINLAWDGGYCGNKSVADSWAVSVTQKYSKFVENHV